MLKIVCLHQNDAAYWNVFEGFCCWRSVVVNFFNRSVSFSGQADALGLDIHNHEDRLRAVLTNLVEKKESVLFN